MPNAPILSPEARFSRQHRRMQLGLALDEERRAERVAARPSFEEFEAESNWILWVGGVVAISCLAWFGSRWPEDTPNSPARDFALAGAPSPALSPSSPKVSPVAASLPSPSFRPGIEAPPTNAKVYYPPARQAMWVPPQPQRPVAPSAPASLLPPTQTAVAAPNYAARDRRITELKQESDALDDFIRNIRANPGVSRLAEPGGYVYEAWRYQRGGWTNSEALNTYLKWLDQRRNEVRREKWRLEGR